MLQTPERFKVSEEQVRQLRTQQIISRAEQGSLFRTGSGAIIGKGFLRPTQRNILRQGGVVSEIIRIDPSEPPRQPGELTPGEVTQLPSQEPPFIPTRELRDVRPKELAKIITRGVPPVELAISPVIRPRGFEGVLFDLDRELETTRQEQGIEGGGETIPILKQQAKGFGLGVVLSLLSSVIFLKQLLKDPVGTIKALPAGVRASFAKIRSGEIANLLREQPGLITGVIVGEIGQQKIGQKAFAKTGDLFEKVITRLDPRFVKVVEKTIDIPIDDGSLTLKIAGTIDDFAEPLSSQAKISGTKVTAVSSQRDIFGTLIRREVIINKPIPNEALLSKSTAKNLKLFREGKLSRNKLVQLNINILRETRGASNLLETSFFADPSGRIRPSRLGLQGGQQQANLLDLLSGDVTFRRGKPQVLFFDDVSVAKFPPALRGIENKLKAGKPLTRLEELRLQKFQLTITGEFKPIGFLSREPEITLAKGEVIRIKSVPVVTLINGRRVKIIRTEIVRDVKLSKLLKKASSGKATVKELAEFKAGTGIDISSILKSKKFISPTGLGASSFVSTFKSSSLVKPISPSQDIAINNLKRSEDLIKKQLSEISNKLITSKSVTSSKGLTNQRNVLQKRLSRNLEQQRRLRISKSSSLNIRDRASVRPSISPSRPSPQMLSLQRRSALQRQNLALSSQISRAKTSKAKQSLIRRQNNIRRQIQRLSRPSGVSRISRIPKLVPRIILVPKIIRGDPTKKIRREIKGGKFEIIVRKFGKDIKLKSANTKLQARVDLRKHLQQTLRASGFVTKNGKKIKTGLSNQPGFRVSKEILLELLKEEVKD